MRIIITIVRRAFASEDCMRCNRIIVDNSAKWVWKIAYLFASRNDARRHQRRERCCSFRGNGTWTLIYTYTRGSTHERVREWLLASLLSFLSSLLFFFYLSHVATRADSRGQLRGLIVRSASPIVCDSGLPLAITRRKRNRAVLVDERIPRVFHGRSPLDFSWSSTITTDSDSICCFTRLSHMVLIFPLWYFLLCFLIEKALFCHENNFFLFFFLVFDASVFRMF